MIALTAGQRAVEVFELPRPLRIEHRLIQGTVTVESHSLGTCYRIESFACGWHTVLFLRSWLPEDQAAIAAIEACRASAQ